MAALEEAQTAAKPPRRASSLPCKQREKEELARAGERASGASRRSANLAARAAELAQAEERAAIWRCERSAADSQRRRGRRRQTRPPMGAGEKLRPRRAARGAIAGRADAEGPGAGAEAEQALRAACRRRAPPKTGPVSRAARAQNASRPSVA
jgi:hypothetical protein